jgi:hypothetical protein
MFNYRIVVANKDLFISIFNHFGKNYADYRVIIDKYNSVFRPIAAWMLARDSDEFAINDIVSHITEYINIKKLNPANIKVTRNDVVINGESSPNLEEFINFVHGNFPVVRQQVVQKRDENLEHIPVLTGDGIKIYKVEQAQDSKELAADTSWCIAYKGPNNMWQSYRSNQAATFFIVWDENPPASNVRKVALQYNSKDIKITDTVNRTGIYLTEDISFEYKGRTITGRDIPTYLTYLKSKGVNIDARTINPETGKEEKILKNKPISPEERLVSTLTGYVKSYAYGKRESPFTEEDLRMWDKGKFEIKFSPEENNAYFLEEKGKFFPFVGGVRGYSPLILPEERIVSKIPFGNDPSKEMYSKITVETDDAKTYLSKFIGTGWILPDRIFNYLFDTPGGNNILVQYVNTGLALPKNQTDRISKNRQLLNSYLKQQLAGAEQGANTDFAFLEYIDTNNEEVKQKILDISSKGGKFRNFPQNWSIALPQIGLKNTDNNAEIDFNDEFVNKLAIIKGIKSVYKKYPTLENTRLLLQIPEAIAPLLERARNEKYNIDMLFNVNELSKWSDLWKIVPDKFKDNPEFTIYKAVDKANYLDYRDYQNLPPSQPGNLLDNLTRIIYLMDDHGNVNADDKNNIEFWKTSIEYFDKLVGSVFKKIHLLHPIGDEDDDNYDEDEVDEDSDKQYQRLSIFFDYLPKEVSSSDEFVNTVKSHARKDVMTFVLDRTNVNEYEKYFKNIREYLDSGQAWRSIVILKPNTFIVNLISNNNDENLLFELLEKLSSSFWDLSKFETLISWYPEVLNKLSDQTFIKILQSSQQYLSPGMISIFANQKPHLFKEYIPLMNTTPQFKQQNPELFQNISREKLEEYRQFQLDRQEQYNRPYQPQVQNQENLIENPEEDEEDEEEYDDEDDEEDVLASVKSMLKIAQKLDFKKEYRLADKLTYIIRKKT